MDIPYSTFDFSNIMSFPISDKAMMDDFMKPVRIPRHKSNHKWTKSLAIILAILLFCSFVGTVLNVHVGKSISRQVSTENIDTVLLCH